MMGVQAEEEVRGKEAVRRQMRAVEEELFHARSDSISLVNDLPSLEVLFTTSSNYS